MEKKHSIILLFISIFIITQLLYSCNLTQNDDEKNDNKEHKKKEDDHVDNIGNIINIGNISNREDTAYRLDIQLSGSLQNPAWSPDGKSIVFTRFRNGYNKEPADIYAYNLETKELKCLVSDNSGNINLPGSVWKSNMIIFSSTRDPHDEIFAIAADGNPGNEIKLTQREGFVAYEPSFSPVENFIVFESHILDVEGNGIIVKKDLSANITSGYTSLTNAGDCRQPNWSPDGLLILYQSLDNNKWDIWTMNTDGFNKTQITTDNGDNTDASFSPDSQKIIYSGDCNLNYANLYVIQITGGIPKRLTTFNGGYDGAPSWSINNKSVFESCNGDPDESSGTGIWIIDIPGNF